MRMAAGIDIGGTKIAVGLVRSDGRVLDRMVEPIATGSAEAPAEQAVRMVRHLAQDCALSGVGVGVPGLPHTAGGGVWAPNIAGWDNFALHPLLCREFGPLPVVVENDGTCAVLGECWTGAGRGTRDAVLIIIGTGIGGGVVANGQVVRGYHGVAGAFGWVPTTVGAPVRGAQPGPLIGPLERVAAGPGLNQAAAALGLADTRELFRACQSGAPGAVSAVRHFTDHLAHSIATITSVIDPAVVMIGGGVSENFPIFEPYLTHSLCLVLHPLADRLRVVPAALGSTAGLIGAARLVLPNTIQEA